jgi:predicted SnoaL-like aldol condensation-catalyzing enzyme
MTNKEIAKDFLLLTSKGLSRKAFDQYVHPNFKHHNVFYKGDRQTLMDAMEQSASDYPNKVFEIQHILQDTDLVAIHSRSQMTPNSKEIALMHIFRFEEDKIMELWDFGQPAPEDMVNENGMF